MRCATNDVHRQLLTNDPLALQTLKPPEISHAKVALVPSGPGFAPLAGILGGGANQCGARALHYAPGMLRSGAQIQPRSPNRTHQPRPQAHGPGYRQGRLRSLVHRVLGACQQLGRWRDRSEDPIADPWLEVGIRHLQFWYLRVGAIWLSLQF